MKRNPTLFLFLLVCSFQLSAQNYSISPAPEEGAVYTEINNADNPCITPQQYQLIDQRIAENIKLLGLDKMPKSPNTVLLNWPLQAATNMTDCSFYALTAYVDQNTATGASSDYNCGTHTYDGHHGTDIMTFPFGFYKMDNSQVEVIAAAAGTIIDKNDGAYDRNCVGVGSSLPANYVIIQHSDGSVALYWHMKNGAITTKAIGQTVTAGEYLGVVGSSGSSSGPHLHFEIWSGSTSATYKDPYYASCNLLNASTWWTTQKAYTETSVIKASVHTTDIVLPSCNTETPNESGSYTIPFQGPGLAPGYAKFYAFFRNSTPGMTATMSILNPGGTTFNTWNYTTPTAYNGSYGGWSKLLPTTAGLYTFQAVYNGITCAQTFQIITSTGIPQLSVPGNLQVFPNPVSENLNLYATDINNGAYCVTLTNVVGQIIFSDNMIVADNKIDRTWSLSGYPDAMYFMTIETATTKNTLKVIKQN
jgi:murein DD-endopeptidase MepM/ murein hydrolase activator NlpD